ncbi:acyl-CoA thioesterase [Scopulibacillus cellulosilyticus]|uniref:Acyl-CoA thioesterase n=1 Tax=Scopulibacillus cellulosilyticus TaxID=2665665 RepID=A0ABW2PTN8_9BACL
MYISETKITVRYAETDQMGVVYHANYLVWLEVGRTQLVEELGFRYASMEEQGVLSPVVDAHLSYQKPAKYGEQVIVKTWVEAYDGIRVTYGYEVVNSQGECCVKANTQHVCVKKESFRPIILKKHFPEWDQAYRRAME